VPRARHRYRTVWLPLSRHRVASRQRGGLTKRSKERGSERRGGARGKGAAGGGRRRRRKEEQGPHRRLWNDVTDERGRKGEEVREDMSAKATSDEYDDV